MGLAAQLQNMPQGCQCRWHAREAVQRRGPVLCMNKMYKACVVNVLGMLYRFGFGAEFCQMWQQHGLPATVLVVIT